MPKKKSTTSSSLSKTSHEAFLRSVRLYAVALDEMSGTLDRDKYWKHSAEPDTLIREIVTTYEPTNAEGRHFDVEAKFELTIRQKGNKGTILKVGCTYRAHFHATSGCTSESVERFAKSEAKIIIWPYFRHFVSDMTGRMYIPPITIPITLD